MNRRPVPAMVLVLILVFAPALSPAPLWAQGLELQCTKAGKEIRALRDEIRSLGKMWKTKGASKKLNRANRLCAEGGFKAAGDLYEEIKVDLRAAVAESKSEEASQPVRR